MAERHGFDVNVVLDRMATGLGIPEGRGRETAIAKFLGISTSLLGNWRRRKSLDYNRVITRWHRAGLSLDWLFYHVGSMRLEPPSSKQGGEQMTPGVVLEELKQYLVLLEERIESGDVPDGSGETPVEKRGRKRR